jgi:hypothetical protein
MSCTRSPSDTMAPSLTAALNSTWPVPTQHRVKVFVATWTLLFFFTLLKPIPKQQSIYGFTHVYVIPLADALCTNDSVLYTKTAPMQKKIKKKVKQVKKKATLSCHYEVIQVLAIWRV